MGCLGGEQPKRRRAEREVWNLDCKESRIECLDSYPLLGNSLDGSRQSYLENIHLSAIGCKLIAEQLAAIVERVCLSLPEDRALVAAGRIPGQLAPARSAEEVN